MVELAGVDVPVPEFSLTSLLIIGIALLVGLFVVIGIIIGTIWLINFLLFNKKVVVFSKVGQHFEPTKRYVARFMPIGNSGDTIFFVKKAKKRLPNPTIQTGRNTYWYMIRDDGEWINIGLEDINQKLKRASINWLDKEVRYARTSIQKNMGERFNKLSWLDKYGGLMAYTVLIFVICIGVFLWLGPIKEITTQSAQIVIQVKEVVIELQKVASALNEIKGSGALIR